MKNFIDRIKARLDALRLHGVAKDRKRSESTRMIVNGRLHNVGLILYFCGAVSMWTTEDRDCISRVNWWHPVTWIYFLASGAALLAVGIAEAFAEVLDAIKGTNTTQKLKRKVTIREYLRDDDYKR